MKKTAVLLIALIIVISSVSFASAERALQINGINVPLVSNDGKLLSIEEINGTIYVPIDCLLNALGINYTITEESVNMTYSPSSGDNSEVDEYANTAKNK